jgi:HEAT repeat protein
VGVFAPIVSIPIVGTLNYFHNGRGDGVIALVLVVIAAFLALARLHRIVWATGLVTILLLSFTLTTLLVRMHDLRQDGEGAAAAEMVELQWGWAVLFVGAVLVVAGPIVAEVQRWPRHRTLVQLAGAASIPLAFVIGAGGTWTATAGYQWLEAELAARKEAQQAAEHRAAEEAARQKAAQAAADRAAREKAEREATNQVAVPLPGQGGASVGDVPQPWANASTQAVQQGDVRVRVSDLKVRGSQFLASLQVENVGRARAVQHRRWEQAAGDERGRLMDGHGASYPCRPPVGVEGAGAGNAQEVVPPGGAATDVLAFDVPRPPVDYLRLELPASAFGGTGQLRLQLPREMILFKAPRLLGEGAIGELCHALKSPSAGTREAAATALPEVGPVAASAVPELVVALKDQEPPVRAAAALALGEVDRQGKRSFPDILAALGDPDADVGTAAATALGKFAPLTSAEIPALREGLASGSPRVRTYAIQQLAAAALPVDDAIRVFAGSLKDSDQAIRGVAKASLERTGPLAEAQVPVLVEVVENGVTDARLYAFHALATLGPRARGAAPTLRSALKGKAREGRPEAAEALAAVDRDSPETLLALADATRDQDGALRKAATGLLKKLSGAAAAKALLDDLADAADAVRLDAADALVSSDLEAGTAAPVLERVILTEQNPAVRTKVARCLVKMNRPNAEVVEALGQALKAKDSSTRREAAAVLSDLGPKAEEAVGPLTAAVKDSDDVVRREAVEALAKIGGNKIKDAVPALVPALKEAETHNAAIDALGAAGASAVPPLITALDDPDHEVREGAAQALGKIGPAASDALRALRFSASNDKDAGVRAAAKEALKSIQR